MNDTSPEMMLKMHHLIQKKTPEERLKMGDSMIATSRYLMTRGLLEQNPNLSEKELRKEIFLRSYGNDFPSSEITKILEHLSVHSSSSFLEWQENG